MTQTIWKIKSTPAAFRRQTKLQQDGITIDTSTQEGRKLIGYQYLEQVSFVKADQWIKQ